jgi:hypothetical protein
MWWWSNGKPLNYVHATPRSNLVIQLHFWKYAIHLYSPSANILDNSDRELHDHH